MSDRYSNILALEIYLTTMKNILNIHNRLPEIIVSPLRKSKYCSNSYYLFMCRRQLQQLRGFQQRLILTNCYHLVSRGL